MRDRLWTCFRLGTTTWALDVLQVREVVRQASPTPVPRSPAHVAGLLNLRGHVVTVVDPAPVLGVRRRGTEEEAGAAGKDGACLVLRNSEELEQVRRAWAHADTSDLEDPGADSIALRVDAVEGVIEVPDEELLPPPPNLDPRLAPFVRGAVTRPDGLVLHLRVGEVLAA